MWKSKLRIINTFIRFPINANKAKLSQKLLTVLLVCVFIEEILIQNFFKITDNFSNLSRVCNNLPCILAKALGQEQLNYEFLDESFDIMQPIFENQLLFST